MNWLGPRILIFALQCKRIPVGLLTGLYCRLSSRWAIWIAEEEGEIDSHCSSGERWRGRCGEEETVEETTGTGEGITLRIGEVDGHLAKMHFCFFAWPNLVGIRLVFFSSYFSHSLPYVSLSLSVSIFFCSPILSRSGLPPALSFFVRVVFFFCFGLLLRCSTIALLALSGSPAQSSPSVRPTCLLPQITNIQCNRACHAASPFCPFQRALRLLFTLLLASFSCWDSDAATTTVYVRVLLILAFFVSRSSDAASS